MKICNPITTCAWRDPITHECLCSYVKVVPVDSQCMYWMHPSKIDDSLPSPQQEYEARMCEEDDGMLDIFN